MSLISPPEHIQDHARLGYPAVIPKPVPSGKVVLIGDSLTNQGDFIGDWGGAVNMRMGSLPFHQANWKLGCPFTEVINKGTDNDTLALMRARFAADVLANRPGYVGIWGGTNPLTTWAAANASATKAQIAAFVATLWADLVAMINMSHNAGIRAMLHALAPRTMTTGQQTFAAGAALFNQMQAEYCLSHADTVYLDGTLSIVDKTSITTFNLFKAAVANYWTDPPRTGPSYELGGHVHINLAGAKAMMPAYCAALAAFIARPPLASSGRLGTAGDQFNLVENSLFFGTGGSVSGSLVVNSGIADGWTLDYYSGVLGAGSSATATKTTHWDDASIPAQKVTIHNNSGTSLTTISVGPTLELYETLTLADASIAPGDTVYAEIEVNVTETSGTCGATMLNVQFFDATTPLDVYVNFPGGKIDDEELVNGALTTSRIRSANFVVPAGATQCYFMCLMLASASSTIEWVWALPKLRKVPTY